MRTQLNGGVKLRAQSLARTVATVVLACATLGASMGIAEAKAPGQTICYKGTCHRVKTISETRSIVGKGTKLHASFYDHCKKDRFNACGLTSSGEVFRPGAADNAASPIYPDGTILLVRNPKTGKAAVIRVNNAGPYWGNRKLDVSRGTAEKLGFKKRGVAQLEVRVIRAPTAAEARYSRNRSYAPVPGYIGTFDSLAKAQAAATLMYALKAAAGNAFGPSVAAALAAAG